MLWCTAGCEFAGGGGGGGVDAGVRYHPEGFAASDVHGPELTLQKQDCRACHGDDLAGGPGIGGSPAPSCDSCHTPADPTAWRSDCTFCHGGVNDETGAPPRNIDGTSEVAAATFPAHAAHVNAGAITDGFDCVQCHTKAIDVLSLGHVFDDTPGVAEVDLGAGLSGLGTYSRDGGCANTYCHGGGQLDDGAVAVDAAPMTCTSCHANKTSSTDDLAKMSGSHGLHVGVTDVTCGDCHADTTTDGATIADLSLHINGQRDLAFTAAGFTIDRDTMECTGTCHGKDHSALVWVRANGRFHPDNYAEAKAHGTDMELQRMGCRGCHGADLTGKGAAPSCDSCHDPDNPTAWRTDCVFCHGGDDTDTGAPPRDLGSGVAAMSLSFNAHTAHVTEGISAAFDCTQCHVKPTDVLSVGHAFDGTPAMAEVTFAGGLSPNGTYDTGTCSGLYCHGNGRADNGTITDGSPARACDSCHPSLASGSSGWQMMSGDHNKHLKINGVDCGTCHSTVTSDGTSIADPALHVDKQKEVAFSEGDITYDAGNKRCTGSCHNKNHSNDRW